MVAHAGGGEKYAEETLPALLHSGKAGAAVEMDVRWTADDVAILLHAAETPTPDKASIRNAIVCGDGPHVVAETRWSVLKRHCSSVGWASDDGKRYPIVTFDKAMRELADLPGVQVFAEIKDGHQSKAQDKEFLETITKYGVVDRTVVSSYRPDALDRFEKAAGREDLFVRRMLNLPSEAGASLTDPAVLKRNGLWAVSLRSDRVTESYFSAVRSAGLVAIAQDTSPPRTGRQRDELTKIWKAMKAAGATTVSTDEPKAYQRFVG